MTLICISKVIISGSDNGLSPGQCQDIIWTNARILLIGPLGTNFNEILIKNHTLSLKKIHFKCLLENGSHFVSPSLQVLKKRLWGDFFLLAGYQVSVMSDLPSVQADLISYCQMVWAGQFDVDSLMLSDYVYHHTSHRHCKNLLNFQECMKLRPI